MQTQGITANPIDHAPGRTASRRHRANVRRAGMVTNAGELACDVLSHIAD